MEEMKDVEFMSAKDKRLVLKQWETFLKNGLKWENFSDRLYTHLHLHCSFIAHYDRRGFYETYFESGDDICHFLSQFDACNAEFPGISQPTSIEIGMTYWCNGDMADINRAMIEVAGKYIPGLVVKAQQGQKEHDVELATLLLAKHGLKVRTASKPEEEVQHGLQEQDHQAHAAQDTEAG